MTAFSAASRRPGANGMLSSCGGGVSLLAFRYYVDTQPVSWRAAQRTGGAENQGHCRPEMEGSCGGAGSSLHRDGDSTAEPKSIRHSGHGHEHGEQGEDDDGGNLGGAIRLHRHAPSRCLGSRISKSSSDRLPAQCAKRKAHQPRNRAPISSVIILASFDADGAWGASSGGEAARACLRRAAPNPSRTSVRRRCRAPSTS